MNAEMKVKSKTFRIKILADSRGVGLSVLLNGNNNRFSFTVDCHPGASISSLENKLS